MVDHTARLLTDTLGPTLIARYPSILEPPLLARLMGMFELNNLALVVPNPLHAYFDSLQEDAMDRVTAMLGKWLNVQCLPNHHAGPFADKMPLLVEPAQGTALYALQSCANHSCCPAALPFKGENEVDGAAMLVAERDIGPGEEVSGCQLF